MKRFTSIIILFATLTLAFSQKGNLKEYMNKEGVTTVTISKNMLSYFPKGADITYGDINVGDFVDKLSAIHVFASHKEEVAAQLIDDVTKFLKVSCFERMLSMEAEKVEHLNLFIQSNEEYISEFVVLIEGKSKESVVMQFTGKFTMEDIQQMIASRLDDN